MTPEGVVMILAEQLKSLSKTKSQVARLLLGNAGNSKNGNKPITHRDMAAMLDTDWGLIHLSLNSLRDDGLIRIERNRIIVTKALVSLVANSI